MEFSMVFVCQTIEIKHAKCPKNELLVRKWTFVQPQIKGWIHYSGFTMPNFNSIFGWMRKPFWLLLKFKRFLKDIIPTMQIGRGTIHIIVKMLQLIYLFAKASLVDDSGSQSYNYHHPWPNENLRRMLSKEQMFFIVMLFLLS